MITGHRRLFEARCLQRGYTLPEVMPCVVSRQGDTWTVDENHPAYPRTKRPAITSGPGSELAKLLSRVWIQKTSSCSCEQMGKKMNMWGPDECEKPHRMQEIVDTLKRSAADRGLPFIESVARLIVRRAIRNARRLQP